MVKYTFKIYNSLPIYRFYVLYSNEIGYNGVGYIER